MRRSARISAKVAAAPAGEGEHEEEEHDDDSAEEAPPPPKRARTAARATNQAAAAAAAADAAAAAADAAATAAAAAWQGGSGGGGGGGGGDDNDEDELDDETTALIAAHEAYALRAQNANAALDANATVLEMHALALDKIDQLLRTLVNNELPAQGAVAELVRMQRRRAETARGMFEVLERSRGIAEGLGRPPAGPGECDEDGYGGGEDDYE